ncbi:MAG: single-stranded DNA-binding protein [Acidobacteria bacterium]|nr:single-stranded DNA-binding protein [Acidobacteriota bacterium]
MVNKVILVGRLGRDPEMRYTPAGDPVCNFTLATDQVYRDRSGERQRRTEWHRIVAWRKLAEQCAQLLGKGKLVYVEGRLRTRQWDDRDGNKRTTTEIEINVMRILTPKGEPSFEMEGQAPAPPEDTAPEITDEDVPF